MYWMYPSSIRVIQVFDPEINIAIQVFNPKINTKIRFTMSFKKKKNHTINYTKQNIIKNLILRHLKKINGLFPMDLLGREGWFRVWSK